MGFEILEYPDKYYWNLSYIFPDLISTPTKVSNVLPIED